MYYIKFKMKNSLFIFVEYLLYLSLVVLIIIYLFPGSIIGYFLYGDLKQQPNLIDNPVGTSINHFFYFIYVSALAAIHNLKSKSIVTNFYFIFLFSILLEISHLIIPNRSFEYYDLFANIGGVGVVFVIKKILNV